MTHSLDDLYDRPPPTVKPRSRTYLPLPVVAICGDEVVAEDGQIWTLAELVNALPERPPTLFTTLGAAELLAQFDETYRDTHPTSWQYRWSTYERDIVRPDGVRVAAKISVIVYYFGWKNGNYHKMIDPVSMYGKGLNEIWPEGPSDLPPIVKLLRWGRALRDFCADNGLDVRPTIGGISSQLLTDRRFYPNARRKVPTATNERVRDELPGNHYQLTVDPDPSSDLRAYYLDQSRAHHYHASTTRFPDADSLYAFGRFTDLAEIVFADTDPNFSGLYCLDLALPRKVEPFRWITPTELDWSNLQAIARKQFVYSNELPHLLDNGYTVLGVRAAWGSRKADTGLPEIARWAIGELDRYGDPAWLKPLLLSTYGMLAVRPRYAETVFRLAKGEQTVSVPVGRRELTGKLVRGRRKLQSGIANVLHRGMIEAATRSDSIGLAQFLQWQGHRVLSIYADAVIVECDDDLELSMLPEPWRCKRTLNHLQFVNQQAFISGEMTKLPGVQKHKYTLRPPRPRAINVAEEMERAEGSLVTYTPIHHRKGNYHGYAEAGSQ